MEVLQITCPKCSHNFELSEVLRKDIQSSVENEYKSRLRIAVDAEKKRVEKEKNEEIQLALRQLKEAQDNELELRKQKTELDSRAKNLELEVQRKIDSERSKIAETIARDTEESHRLKDAEKDKKISDALAQVDELKRKMEQGSQQAQGEVFELELENALKITFPEDEVAPVAKGIKGGDILHVVKARDGADAGSILWELKRTKTFSQGWLQKLREDSRQAKAELSILVTEAMPEGFEDFMRAEGGIWVVSIRFCMPLCHALRAGILRAHSEKNLQASKKEKAELIYDYLIGVEFKGRMEAIIEAYKIMREDLDSEKRAVEKLWAKREKQIGVVTQNLAGLHGDIEGLAGQRMLPIPALSLEGK